VTEPIWQDIYERVSASSRPFRRIPRREALRMSLVRPTRRRLRQGRQRHLRGGVCARSGNTLIMPVMARKWWLL
jgi:hypothetical protein